jgi:hypothetical protein
MGRQPQRTSMLLHSWKITPRRYHFLLFDSLDISTEVLKQMYIIKGSYMM